MEWVGHAMSRLRILVFLFIYSNELPKNWDYLDLEECQELFLSIR